MNIVAYPLQWPTGWPKTQYREDGRFQQSLEGALSKLKKQVELMGGKNLILSSNYTLGSKSPPDPGVVAYFDWNKLKMAIPCDRWRGIESNVYAISLTIEAMRGMERWGAKHMIEAMFTGFKAIPEKTGGVSWWSVLGVPQDSKAEEIAAAYRKLAKERHPDKPGGSHDAMAQLNEAYRVAMNQLDPAKR